MGSIAFTYKKGAVTTTSITRKYLGNGIYSCEKNAVQAYTAAQKVVTVSDSVSKTYTKGDHVHSRPFSGIYREQSPLAGSFDTVFYQRSSDSIHCVGAGNTSTCTSDFGYYVQTKAADAVPWDAKILGRLKSAADTKAFADLNRSYYSLGIILAERLRTIDYIVSKTKQLHAVLKHRSSKDLTRFLQSRKADRKQLAKDLAGEHLAFIFGLLPLIDEISGLADLLSSSATASITGRGRMAQETVATIVASQVHYGADYPRALFISTDTKLKYSARTSVSMEVSIAAFQKMRDHGLNAVATAYDMVPLLFLSDFISNTGTYLRSYDPLVGLSFKTGNTTYWLERNITTTCTGIHATTENGGPSGLTVTSNGLAQGLARYLYVKRDVLTELPEAVWMLQNNLSLSKAATIGSLAIQRLIKPIARIKALREFRYKGPRPKYLPPIKYN